VVTNPDSSTVTLGPYQVQVNGAGGVVDNNTPLAPNTGVGRVLYMTVDLLFALVAMLALCTVIYTVRSRALNKRY